MSPLFTGHHQIELNRTASTNRFAWDLLKDSPSLPEGTVVRAALQTEGRGQAGTSWYSTEGHNLTFSVIYYPSFVPSRDVFLLSKMVSVALREAIAFLLPGHQVKIKWPNDIWVDGKKAAGILIENQLEGALLKATVIGIGLNVNESSFPAGLEAHATSLKLVSGEEFDLEMVLDQVLSKLEAHYLQLRAGQIVRLEQAYYDYLLGYQQQVPLQAGSRKFTGRILGVDASGRLRVEEAGTVHTFEVKEVRMTNDE